MSVSPSGRFDITWMLEFTLHEPETTMTGQSDDPFDLCGKNLRRLAPQIRRNIKLQKTRVLAAFITFLVCLAIGVLASRTTGLLFFVSLGLLLTTPFSLLAAVADHHLMRRHQRRLAEVERRLNEAGPE